MRLDTAQAYPTGASSEQLRGVYTVTSQDVPGLVTEGSTPDEIVRNAQEALDGLLEVWADLKISHR